MITITDDTADKIYSGAILQVWSQCLQGVLPESGAPSSLGSDGDEEAPVFKKIAEDGAKVFNLKSHHSKTKITISQEEMEEDGEESAPAEDLFSEIHLGQLKKVRFYQLSKLFVKYAIRIETC